MTPKVVRFRFANRECNVTAAGYDRVTLNITGTEIDMDVSMDVASARAMGEALMVVATMVEQGKVSERS